MAIEQRRTVLRTAALGAAAALAGGPALAAQPEAQAEPAGGGPGAFRGQHQPKPLPFDPTKLKGLSERLLRSHWENNYGGAVRALNAVEQRLDALMKDKDLPAYVYADLKREELLRTGSLVLHERYFANLGGGGTPAGRALELIKTGWGGYEAWEAEFKRTANGLAGGSGWVVFALNLHTGEAHNYWAADHATQAVLGAPLLVLDMYEHSYHMDFGAAAGRYVDAFMDNVNWDEVARRAEWAAKAAAS